MAKDMKHKFMTQRENGNLWHGFSISYFEVLCEPLLKHLEAIQRQVSTLKAFLNRALKQGTIETLTTSDDPVELAGTIDKLLPEMQPCIQNLESMQKALGEWRSAERGTRRVRFEGAAKERGWRLIGNWPEPVVAGTVFVVVDGNKEKATINGRAIGGLPTAEKLIAQIEMELRELDKNKTEPEKFISDLWQAYRSCGGRINEGILVFDLLRELLLLRQPKDFFRNPTGGRFRPYPVAQFRADLTGYLASGAPPARDGSAEYGLDIVGGSFAEQGLFMYFPQADRLATCGRLTFRSAST